MPAGNVFRTTLGIGFPNGRQRVAFNAPIKRPGYLAYSLQGEKVYHDGSRNKISYT
jgi:hypothetical protein